MSQGSDDSEFSPEKSRQDPSLESGGFRLPSYDETRAHQFLYECAYRELCEVITGDKPLDQPPEEISFQEKVREFLDQNRQRLYQKICIEFKYCERMKKNQNWEDIGVNTAMIAMALADLGMTAGIGSALWFINRRLLDEFCHCNAT